MRDPIRMFVTICEIENPNLYNKLLPIHNRQTRSRMLKKFASLGVSLEESGMAINELILITSEKSNANVSPDLAQTVEQEEPGNLFQDHKNIPPLSIDLRSLGFSFDF
ncbi:hypothetical protein H8K35_08235 [Undibacterium sp. LX40W]|uniref:Uncharacterized protein n=1 Tax=Undibacterium nitidum TaxID=2762298 RepID=A0A923HND8_9BURK|nr:MULTISPECIES: hypothetical protein [Undibacterium]MBC3881578.1 hypothetical protein [Undibacterium nitidum]MBC3891640.1 hypothetical protein [Undibacterium sp. LX40W]